jgi:hypothetical protein
MAFFELLRVNKSVVDFVHLLVENSVIHFAPILQVAFRSLCDICLPHRTPVIVRAFVVIGDAQLQPSIFF